MHSSAWERQKNGRPVRVESTGSPFSNGGGNGTNGNDPPLADIGKGKFNFIKLSISGNGASATGNGGDGSGGGGVSKAQSRGGGGGGGELPSSTERSNTAWLFPGAMVEAVYLRDGKWHWAQVVVLGGGGGRWSQANLVVVE